MPERELSEEEYESLSPSDRAHYDVTGRTGDGFSTGDTEATKVARTAAFELDNAQADDYEGTAEDRAQELEDAKEAASTSNEPGPSGTAGEEAAGIGVDAEGSAQTREEAQAAEEARREGFSPAEKEEAEVRDRAVYSTGEHEGEAVPNVGSPDEEGREDANASESGENERYGTPEDERTQP